MIIHCDACGKAVSNRLERCPFCQFAARPYKESNPSAYRSQLEELIPTFQKRTIGY